MKARWCTIYPTNQLPGLLTACFVFQVAMQLLEKDIHDKQDTLISLRRQLEDIKKINLDLHTKWQVRILIMVARGQGESLDQCCLE